MKKIIPYPIKDEKLVLPTGSKILSVVWRRNNFYISVLVDPDIKDMMVFSILIVASYQDMDTDINEYTFLGSVQILDDTFLTHVFYKLDKYVGLKLAGGSQNA